MDQKMNKILTPQQYTIWIQKRPNEPKNKPKELHR